MRLESPHAAPLIGLGVVALALAVRGLVLNRIARVGHGDETRPLEIVRRALRFPSVLWSVVLGLYVWVEAATLPPRLFTRAEILLQALIIASISLTAANLLAALVVRFSERRTMGIGVTGLARAVTRAAVLTVGGLILLGHLGISIVPILTALGVGGLAVALALQDTLSNLFAGIHLLADKPIRVRDLVRLESGIEGFVEDIGWRSTRIRTLTNYMVIVPNAKIAQSAITNFDLPEARLKLSIPIGVSYAADPDHVERVLIEEATQAAATVPGFLTDPKPVVWFMPGFGDSALQFTLVCTVASFVDQYPTQTELRKRIIRRFRAEGIEIPFPIRTVELRTPDGKAPGS